MRVYNSLTKRIENFIPINEKEISIYVCGPTVYDELHIGNTRPVVFFDILKRYFEYRGFKVTYVTNITDVDDKIINRAKEKNVSEKDLSVKYTNEFINLINRLEINMPSMLPRATDYIDKMIDYIEDLIDKGYAYKTNSGVYFRVNKVSDYGILSNQILDELEVGVRIELESDKEDPKDFSLWKVTKDGLNFDSPFGQGRPGWHTECAVMNHEIFSKEIDIHGGGSDLKFPHHENEIAQTMAHDHHHLAKYWMHVGRLDINSAKMSKSLGNFVYANELIIEYGSHKFKYFFINHHYRQSINYSKELFEQIASDYDRIERALKKATLILKANEIIDENISKEKLDEFILQMEDDFNTPNVVSLMQHLTKEINKGSIPDVKIYNTLRLILEILGINPVIKLDEMTLEVYYLWIQARNNKDYDSADKYRNILIEEGWI